MRRRLLLDSNLLALLVVGMTGRHWIPRHKRMHGYTTADFDRLTQLVVGTQIVTTPHSLAEVSNLVRQIAEPARSHIARTLQRVVTHLDEVTTPSRTLVDDDDFTRVGLADIAALHALNPNTALLSADRELCGYATKRGYLSSPFDTSHPTPHRA